MAIVLIEGFDHYASLANSVGKWTSYSAGTISVGGGRNGTNALTHTTQNNLQKSVTALDTYVVGFALKVSATKAWSFLEFRDGSTVQIGIYTDTSNNVIIRRNGVSGTVLYTTSYSIPINTWIYVEMKAKIHNTLGTFNVRVNGVSITGGEQTGQNTRQSANNYLNNIFFNMTGIGASTHWLDDIYIFDTTDTRNNDFIGDVRVETIFPTSDGYLSEWVGAPTAGSGHYTYIDETDPDSETGFLVTSGVGFIDSFGFGNLTTLSGSVYGVQVNMWARKDDAGARSLGAITRPTSTTYSGATAHAVGNTYQYYETIFETNPDTGNYWTIAQVNAAEFGIKEEA